MKTNMINTNSVMKKMMLLVCLIVLCVLNIQAKGLAFEFTETIEGWPTSSTTAQTADYTITNTYTFSLGAGVYINTTGGYLMLTGGTSLGLPAISGYKLTQVALKNSSGCSTSTKVKITTTSAGSTAVSGGGEQTFSTTSTWYTYDLSSTSANTMYYIYVSSSNKNCQLVQILLTYVPTTKYTVTFDPGTGSCSKASLTESSAASGITLPSASPASSCSSEYEFMGWAKEEIDETDEEPILYFAGNKYYPESNCTLYAVYVKDKAATAKYEIISNQSQLVTGEQYVIEAYSGGYDYALKAEVYNSNYLARKDISSYITDNVYYESTPDGEIVWTITRSNETTVSLYNSTNSKYLWIRTSSPYYLSLNAEAQTFTLSWEDHGDSEGLVGTFAFKSSNKYVNYAAGYNDFGSNNYSNRNIYLYKRIYSGTFDTNPVCCSTDRTLAFEKAGTTIYWPDGTTFTNTASPSAGSGTVSYAITDADPANCATVNSSGVVTFTTFGVVEVTASIPVDGSYCAAEESYILEMACKSRTVSFASEDVTRKTYVGTYTQTASASAGSGAITYSIETNDGFTINSSTGEVTFSNAGEAIITATIEANGGYCSETGNYMLTVVDPTYSDYRFSCADLQLDEPANGADNVVSNVVYLTSTNGQKVRSLAHFRVHGDGLTASQTVKFTTGDDDLDELYTFRKADGTEVATNSSGVVDEEVYIFYQPTTTTDGRDVATSVKAYVERKGDGSGKPKAVVNDERTINGRHLPSQFIIAAKSGGVWYALPSDASVTGAQMGYTFTADNTTTPTKATVAPQTALYSIYAPRADGTNKSYVRFASTNDGKTLWSNNSTSKIGIKDNAAVDGPSSKGDQYEWRLENTSADSYKLWNNASYDGAGRYLGLSGTKWNVYETNVSIVQDLKILPVDAISDYIGLEATEWEETAFSFTITSGSEPDPYDHVVVGYNGKNYDASISGTKLTITDADFVTDGGFGAASGSQLIVAWCDDEDVVLAQGSVLSPIIVNSNTVNLSEYDSEELSIMDVFITNGAKLTINESTTVHNVTVNPGATLFVNETDGGDAVTMQLYNGKLMLRGGWTTISGDAAYDMPRVYINPLSTLTKTNTNVNFDISVDKRNYYPFAVPFRVRVKDVNYANPTLRAAATYGTHYVIKEYSGKLRADNGPDRENNWVVVPKTDPESGEDVYLEPGKGYILTAVSIPAYGGGIIRFPMSFANAWTTLGEQGSVSATTKNVIEVTAHEGAATSGGGANNRHKGWNMLGVPFMSCYTSGTDMYDGEGSADLMTGRMTLTGDPADPYGWETGDVVYVSVPSHDFAEYVQTDITEAKLRPAWSFFIQVGTTGDLTFLTTKQREDSDMPIYAPKRETSPVMKTGIILSGGEASDKTTIIVSDKYHSADYEVGADLEKMFGNGYTLATYSLSGSTRLAYNAMSKSDAQQVIPIGYRAPAEGEYTYSLNPRYAEANFERVDLIDYQTGSLTNLMTSSYTFTTGRTQDDSRFALNVVMKPTITTDIENGANGENDANGVEKVIINDHMYIIRSGQMYDATGKCVKGGQK